MLMVQEEVRSRLRGLHALVGNTPLLAISCTVDGRPRVVQAKAENLSLTGSIKDRMALHILRHAYETGAIRPGDRIVEASSGNTGISFAAIGRALGHPVTIFMPDWMSTERVQLTRSLGAEVQLVSESEGGFLGSIRLARELGASQEGVFLPEQFANVQNIEAHARSTGPEIHTQLMVQGHRPDAFVAGVGTGGTVMGVGRFLRDRHPAVRIHPVEPSNSPTLSVGHKVGNHRIQGISDEFVPPVVDLESLDPILGVDDGDAILMAQRLARELGLGVGISSGANFLAAAELAASLDEDAVVVTVFPDSNKKYLSTALLGDEPVRPHFRSPAIALRSFAASGRSCQLCFQPPELGAASGPVIAP